MFKGLIWLNAFHMPELELHVEDQDYRKIASYDQTALARGVETLILDGCKNLRIEIAHWINILY